MNRAIGIASLVSALALTAVSTPAAHAAAPLPSDSPVLFSALAPASTVTVSAYSTSITIPADSPTTWFTDRPNRKAGVTTAGQLASRGVPQPGNYGATELFIDGTASTTTTRTFSADCQTVTEVTTTTNADGTTTQTSSTMTYTPFDDAYKVCSRFRLGGKTVNA